MPITASQTLIKLFISFPHRVHSKRCSLSETGLQMLMLCDGVFHSPHETRSSRYFLLAQVDSETVYLTPVILFHSSWRFVSRFIPAAQWEKSLGVIVYCLPTNPISFTLPAHCCWWDFLFLSGKKNSLEAAWGKKINKGNDIDVCGFPDTQRGFTRFGVPLLSSRNIYSSFFCMTTSRCFTLNEIISRFLHNPLLFLLGKKPVDSLIRQLVSFYMIMFILLSVRKREKNISKKFWIAEFFKCSAV